MTKRKHRKDRIVQGDGKFVPQEPPTLVELAMKACALWGANRPYAKIEFEFTYDREQKVLALKIIGGNHGAIQPRVSETSRSERHVSGKQVGHQKATTEPQTAG